jgi:hypothetical protein
VKLQHNRGGGAFPHHFDNPGLPNARALTCLCYFNPVRLRCALRSRHVQPLTATLLAHAWQPGDGGELVLSPFLAPEVALAPLMDRCVLFLSDRMLHRTARSEGARLAVTTWFDGDATNAPQDVGLRLPPSALADVAGTVAALRASPQQRAVSRAVYAEEYARSLVACMQGTEGEAQMLEAHAAHLAAVAANPPLARLVAALRELKPRDHGAQ